MLAPTSSEGRSAVVAAGAELIPFLPFLSSSRPFPPFLEDEAGPDFHMFVLTGEFAGRPMMPQAPGMMSQAHGFALHWLHNWTGVGMSVFTGIGGGISVFTGLGVGIFDFIGTWVGISVLTGFGVGVSVFT